MKTVDKIRDLTQRLPRPESVFNLGGERFEIYRVKDLLRAKWLDRVLKKLLLMARSSYARYGNRSLLDRYDSKSAIYLARAIYPLDTRSKIEIEEWLSIRFTPGNGEPLGNGELELYSFSGRSIAEYLKKECGLTGIKFMKSVLASSRMCGIHPRISNGKAGAYVNMPAKHRHTAICFALIQDQFYRDYGYPYLYITEIIRPDLAEKSLVVTQQGRIFNPASTPAHYFMGLTREEIELDMEAYAYQFPLYWLNIPNLMDLLDDLVKSGNITNKTIKHYLGVSSIDKIKGKPMLRLKSLLGARGRLVEARITGAQLRDLIKTRVGYVPELKINNPREWRQSIVKMIQAARVEPIQIRSA